MGHIVRRPPVEGIGEKPTTPKPVFETGIAIHPHLGSKPTSDKPTEKPATAAKDQKNP